MTATAEITTCWQCGQPIDQPEDAPGTPEWLKTLRPKRFACPTCVEADERREAAKAKRLVDWTSEDVANAPEEAMALIGVPKHWRGASFDGCTDIAGPSVEAVQRWASSPGGVLYVSGPAGSGKSFLAVSALRYIAQAGILALHRLKYTSEGAYQDTLKASYGQDNVDARSLPTWSPRHVPVLVFDDLASSRLTDWMLSEVIGLLEGRHGDELATIVTSNHTLNMISRTMDGRLASRIVEDGATVQVQGRDLRLASRAVPA